MSKSDAYRAKATHFGELARKAMSKDSRERLLQIQRSYLLIARAEDWLTETATTPWHASPGSSTRNGDTAEAANRSRPRALD